MKNIFRIIIFNMACLLIASSAWSQSAPISQLPSAGALSGAEVFPLVQNGVTKKSAVSAINTFVGNAYTGSGSLTTTGTVTNGTWAGTPVGIAYGGLGGTTGLLSFGNLMGNGGTVALADAGPQILSRTALLARYPTFWTTPSISVPNAVLTPGSTGSTTYTGSEARGFMIQEFYLYTQRQSLLTGAQHFANLHIASCNEAITSGVRFGIKINSPIFIPRYVCPDDGFSWERDGTGVLDVPRNNWNGNPHTSQLNNNQQYMMVMASGGTTAPGKTIITANSTGSDGGSAFAYGRMYDVGNITLQATGSGGPVSGTSVCTVANGDTASPSAGAVFTVSTTSGGVASAITSPASGAYSRYGSNTGHYYLPPVLQRWQWTVANGWDGDSGGGNADGSHPKVFADETNYYYKTTCTNSLTGVTVSMTFQPDWCLTGVQADVDSSICTTRTDGPGGTNSYFGIFPGGSANTGFVDQVYVAQGRETFTANYGYTNSVLIAGYEVTVNYIQTNGSYYGLLMYGSDVVVRDFNSVNEAIMAKMRGGGGMHLLHARFDTPVDSINSDGHAFEMDHCSACSLNTWDYISTGSSTSDAGAQLRLGADTSISNSSNENTNSLIGPGIMSSDKTAGGNLTALYCAFTNSTSIGPINVSNTGFGNTARTQLFTKFADFSGGNCETTTAISGSINGQAGNIFTGTVPNASINVWDDNAKGFAGPLGVYRMSAAGAPVDGTTADNKAPVGSTYENTTTGTLYVNTGTITDSVWKIWFNAIGNAGPPTIASGACGTTTNGTITAGSTNSSFEINIGAAATTTCTVSFTTAFPVAPKTCVFSPGSAGAAALGTTIPYSAKADVTTTAFVLHGAALATTVWEVQCQ